MRKEKKTRSRNTWLMQFLISVLGTAIGVGLTFAVNNKMENRKKDQAQRLTAMMVIHDIDETVDQLKTMKATVESEYHATTYLMEHLGELDSVPTDTLLLVADYLVQGDQEFRFDMSKEKIFHSSPDTWQNLGSMKFIDNVQSFYYDRQLFQDLMNKSNIWRKPVPMSEFEKVQVKQDNVSVEQYMGNYYALLREFVKEKLGDGQAQYYVNCSAWRIDQLIALAEDWSKKNDENKFLMSITDEELEDYVNSINQNGTALTEKSLIGKWVASSTNENAMEWEFRKDHTYSYVSTQTSAVNLPFSRGMIISRVTESGTWTIKGDSLILVVDLDAVDAVLDDSQLVALPGGEDMLDSWVKENDAYLKEFYRMTAENNMRNARKARLDNSRDKLELTGFSLNQGGEKERRAVYLKRR